MSPWKYSWKGSSVVPGRVGVELLVRAVHRPAAVGALAEQRDEPVGEVVGDRAQGAALAGAGRVLDQEVVAEEAAVGPQGVDDERVDGEPHRPAPVRVAAEQPGRRLARRVVDAHVHAGEVRATNGSLAVAGGDRADAVRREQLVLVEQPVEDAGQPLRADDGQQPALGAVPQVAMVDVAGELRAVLDEPVEVGGERRAAPPASAGSGS